MDDKMLSQWYKHILDSLSEGVCVVDRKWKIMAFNLAAQKLTGVSAEKALTLSFGEMFNCEVCECRSLLAEVMESGKPISAINTRISDSKMQPVPVSLNATPFLNEHGEIVGLVASFLDNRPIELLRKELRRTCTFGDIVTKDPKMLQIIDILPDISDSDSSVLITGESGTGKELVARAIHSASPRAEGPFIAVNCAALPDTLLESELFGYVKGAFTDAKKDKPGRFALAEGGTLFLDEIGDISPAMQVRLLRVLQEKIYEPLGAVTAVKSNVRILAATNRDLNELMQKDEFRSDLYYRLNVIELELPPLRERLNDIPLLSEHFLEKFQIEKGRGVKLMSPKALRRLLEYNYPGNIRELENILERAYILCRYNEIREDCLPPQVFTANVTTPLPTSQRATAHSITGKFVNLRTMPDDEERRLIISKLDEFAGNRKMTADNLGINPSTLWRKMKKYGLID